MQSSNMDVVVHLLPGLISEEGFQVSYPPTRSILG
jgi:hypothetical protein